MQFFLRRGRSSRAGAANQAPGAPTTPVEWIVPPRGDSDVRFNRRACRCCFATLLISTVVLVPSLVIAGLVHTVRYEAAPFSRNIEAYNDFSADWSFESQVFLDTISAANQSFPFFGYPTNRARKVNFSLVTGVPDSLPFADVPDNDRYPTPRPYAPVSNVKLVLGPADNAGAMLEPVTRIYGPSDFYSTSFAVGPVTYSKHVSASSTPRPSRSPLAPSSTSSPWRSPSRTPSPLAAAAAAAAKAAELSLRSLQGVSATPTPSESPTRTATRTPSVTPSASSTVSPWTVVFESVFGATYSPLCPDPQTKPGTDPSCLGCPYGILVTATPRASPSKGRSNPVVPTVSPYCLAQTLAVGACLVVDPLTLAPAVGGASGPGCALLPSLPDGQTLYPPSYYSLCPNPSLTNPSKLSIIQYSYAAANNNAGRGLSSWAFPNFTVEVRSAADPAPLALALTQGSLDFGAAPVALYNTAVVVWASALGCGIVLFSVAVCTGFRGCDALVTKAQALGDALAVRDRFREQYRERELQRALVPPAPDLMPARSSHGAGVATATAGVAAAADDDEAIDAPAPWVSLVAGRHNDVGATAAPAAVIARPLGHLAAGNMRQPLLLSPAEASVSDLSASLRESDWNISGTSKAGGKAGGAASRNGIIAVAGTGDDDAAAASMVERAPSIDRQRAWIETLMSLPHPAHIPADRWQGMSAGDREIALSEAPDAGPRRLVEDLRRHVLVTEESAFFASHAGNAGADDPVSALAVAATAGLGPAGGAGTGGGARGGAALTVSDSYRRLLLNGHGLGSDRNVGGLSGPSSGSRRHHRTLRGCMWRCRELFIERLVVEFFGLVGYVQYQCRRFIRACATGCARRCCCATRAGRQAWAGVFWMLTGVFSLIATAVMGSSFQAKFPYQVDRYYSSSDEYETLAWVCSYTYSSPSSSLNKPAGGTSYGCTGPSSASSSSSTSSANAIFCAYAGHEALVEQDPRLASVAALTSISEAIPVLAAAVIFIACIDSDRACCGRDGAPRWKVWFGATVVHCCAVVFGAVALISYYLLDLDAAAANALCSYLYANPDVTDSGASYTNWVPDYCAPYSPDGGRFGIGQSRQLTGGPLRFVIGMAMQMVASTCAVLFYVIGRHS